MTDTDIEEGYVQETWLCMGRRLSGDYKMFYVWRDPSGKELHYDKLKGHAGRHYLVTRKAEGTSVKVDPIWLNETVPADNPDRLIWEAKERADLAALELHRLEMADAKDSAITDLVAPLRDLYKRQVGPGRRAAFLAIVTEMMTR